MKNIIEEIQHNGYNIVIGYDENPISPREEFRLTEIATIKKGRYKIGEVFIDADSYDSIEEMEKFLKNERNAICIKPLFIYDHGGVVLKTSPFNCPFDSGRIGFVYTTKSMLEDAGFIKSKNSKLTQKLKDKLNQLIDREIDEYTKWIMGHIYAYKVYKNNEIVSCCYGYYSIDDAINDAKENLQ